MFLIMCIILSVFPIYYYYLYYCEDNKFTKIPIAHTSANFLSAPDITNFDYQKLCIKKHGSIFRWTGGSYTIIGISDPKLTHEVLVYKNKLFSRAQEGTDNYDPIYSHNVFSSNGVEWKRYKSLLSPAFSDTNLKDIFEGYIDESTRELCNLWEKDIGDSLEKLINVSNNMKELALDVIGSAGFGIKLNTIKNDDLKIIKWTSKWIAALQFTSLIPPILHNYTFLGIFKVMRDFYQVSRQFKEFLSDVIAQRYKEIENSSTVKKDLLSMMISESFGENDGLTKDELLGNSHVLMVAGHETTANMLQWCFYFLALYPEIQRKVQMEVDSIKFGDRPLTYEEYSTNFQYLKAVMNETLRLKPPANVIGRLSEKDVMIGDYNIPKGTDVWILIRCLHEDPSYWGSDFSQFRPERFLEREIDCRYFIPFGYGVRKCLGMKFAEMEGILMLIKAMKTFSVKMPDGEAKTMYEEKQEFFLQPKNDIKLLFSKRL